MSLTLLLSFFGQVISPHRNDKFLERSQVSTIAHIVSHKWNRQKQAHSYIGTY